MKKLILPTIIIIFVFLIASFAQNAPDTNDFQIWNDTSVSIPLKTSTDKNGKEFERMAVFINGTLRFGSNASRPMDERIGFGFNYRLNKHISFAPDIFLPRLSADEKQKRLRKPFSVYPRF